MRVAVIEDRLVGGLGAGGLLLDVIIGAGDGQMSLFQCLS